VNDWNSLRSRLTGDLVLPPDSGYGLAKQLQLAEFDAVDPGAVAYCATPSDVQACLSFARDGQIHVAARSGGHSFAGWSTTGGLVVDLSRMGHIEAPGSTVRLGPGAQAVDVVTAFAGHDRQVVTGLCPTVCPTGFVTGGGIGWQTRKHGLAADHLVSAELVLADGRLVRCSADQEPELFWALRGGGAASFGVVVDLETRPVPTGRLVPYTVMWSWEHALDLLYHWQAWICAAPRELSSEIGVVLMDVAPGAEPTVLMFGGYFGHKQEFDAELAELCAVAGADPLMVTGEALPYDQAMLEIYRCRELAPGQRRRVGTAPEAALPRQGFLRESNRLLETGLGHDVLGEALEIFDGERRGGQLRNFALSALSGAAGEVGRADTAYAHRDARFLAKYTLVGPDPELQSSPGEEERDAAERWVARGINLIGTHTDGASYLNFPDPALPDWKWAYHGENYERLVEVKKTYDPDGFLTYPQSIGS
jgi:FAD/FMN-containing dehydrogenase